MAITATTKYNGLGAALRGEIAKRGTTMEKASIELGLAPNAISRWNTGSQPSAEHYELLMNFLSVSLSDLARLMAEDQLTKAGLPRPRDPRTTSRLS
jgi:transcriptional regulator with XRE-family HTH domain